MTLSRRTTLATGAALSALLAVLYLVVSQVMLNGFSEVERRTTVLNAERATQAVELAAETLGTKLADWSTWDDTYQFMADGNAAYIESNLTATGLEALKIESIAFFRADDTLAHATTLNEDGSIRAELPSALLDAITARPEILIDSSDLLGVREGVLSLSDGVYIIASRNILTSDAQGPSRGRILFTERLDEQRIAEMGTRLRFQLDIQPLSAAEATLPALRTASVTPLDDQRIIGEALIPDLLGAPALRATVTIPRFVHQQALQTANLLAVTLSVAAVACVGMTLLVLRWTILGRLARLHDEVQSIGTSGDMAGRVQVSGADELSHLAEKVNWLLERIANSQAALASAKAAAERANQAKSDFLANMSHEVRTPLTSILGFGDLLAEQLPETAASREGLDAIRRNGRHLLAVINDILDLSKIEAGRMTVETISCSPILLAREVVEILRERAAIKRLHLGIAIDGRVPAIIESDPLRLRQILLNLTGNAIKFTTEGSVTIRLGHDQAKSQLLVDVIDTGAGLTDEQAARLFVPFTQGDRSIARLHGGTGLGLTISNKLAELLGGNVTVLQTGPSGSTFRVRIATGEMAANSDFVTELRSLPADPLPSEGRVEFGTDSRPLAGARILLAEDGPDNQRLLSFLLKRAGATVELAADGQRAVECALAARADGRAFHLILMDIQMPIMDGFAATRRLRSEGVTQPILALTAHAMEGDRLACLEAGCDGYASKPIDRTELIDTCRRLIGMAAGDPSARRAA
jgi:signal transduction histidine kinase/ActR/RegA family two-component response regulator